MYAGYAQSNAVDSCVLRYY